nr:MAG TPA: hypothetical protein [Caudoviricetes sp.]
MGYAIKRAHVLKRHVLFTSNSSIVFSNLSQAKKRQVDIW